MGHTCTIAKVFLIQYLENQEWLHEMVGDKDSTLGSFGAYYSFLNILDFVSAAKNNLTEESKHLPRAPMFSVTSNHDYELRGNSLLEANADFLRELVQQNGLTSEHLAELWPVWLKLCYKWLVEVYPGHFHVSIPHNDFPEMIKKPSERLDTL